MKKAKPEIRCRFCGSLKVTRKGQRKTKTGLTQMYHCRSCGKRFSLNALPDYSYPVRAILTAPLLYYSGKSLQKCSDLLAGRYKIKPSLATVNNWIKKFGKYASNKKERKPLLDFIAGDKLLWKKKLEHGQSYDLLVNQYKLSRMPGDWKGLTTYIKAIIAGKLVIRPDLFKSRASILAGQLNLDASRTTNYATEFAGLALKASRSNYQRRGILQKYFLVMDKATIAAEVPVYLTGRETSEILAIPGGLLGHIDFLQVFNKNAVIMDYKPDASNEKNAAGQLLLHAVALSRRTGIHLKNISCAWFDDKDHYRFNALKAYLVFKKDLKRRG